MLSLKSRLFLIVFLSVLFTTEIKAQPVKIIKSPELFQMIDHCENSTSLKVYNFWATWCAPCIRELPQFESLNESFGNVDVTLVSIDDVDLLEKKVKPFIQKKNIKSSVALLDETDFNDLITRIDENWSGAIPATLIVDCRNGSTIFFEKEFKEGELKKTIDKIINQ